MNQNDPIFLKYTTLTTPVPDFIYDGLKPFSDNANGYRPQPKELIQKLAEKHQVLAEMVLLTAGADEAIQMCALAFGSQTYIFPPTYVVYADTTDFNAHIVEVPVFKNGEYKVSTEKRSDATLFFLANPNNPFGVTTREDILELVKNNPQAIVVIDEVYAEFADLSVMHEVQNYKNLVILRSFSKSYGMAGNRIGYIVAQPEVVEKLKRKTQFANVSYLSVGAALTALKNEKYYHDLRQGVIDRRLDFEKFLQSKNLQLLPSVINCVALKFSTQEEGTHFAQKLEAGGFIISHGNGSSNVGLDPSFVRIAIGTDEEMTRLKTVITEML
jgi:histidinol-phosphate aminotransferase